jgi:hypothetical protein
MREQNDRESAPPKPNEEPRKPEQAKKQRRQFDSLIDDNPLICRGID